MSDSDIDKVDLTSTTNNSNSNKKQANDQVLENGNLLVAAPDQNQLHKEAVAVAAAVVPDDKNIDKDNSEIKQSLFNKDDYERLITDPISMAIMEDAVISPCGHSFDKNSIEGWLERQSTCPLCKKPLTSKDLAPNYTLRELIQEYDKISDIAQSPSEKVSKEQEEIASQISSMLDQLTILSSKISPNNKTGSTGKINIAPEIPKPTKDIVIRELLADECTNGSKLLERATRNDGFMDYIFQNVYWRKTGSEWYLDKMLNYAVKRARVWGLFHKSSPSKQRELTGVMICQPPGQIGVSITEMVKVGFAAAPLKIGMAPLTRILALFDLSEKTHQQLTRDTPHWYVNCLCIEPESQNQLIGTELLNTVIKLADAQKVAVYTDTASLASLRFFNRFGFKVIKHVSPSICPFWALMRYPQSE